MSLDAMKQALEALEMVTVDVKTTPNAYEASRQAITALRAAIEQAQKPVAWMVYTIDGKSVCVTDNPADFTDQHKALPLYAAPPQWQGLTDEERHGIREWQHIQTELGPVWAPMLRYLYDAIEAKLKEKNNG